MSEATKTLPTAELGDEEQAGSRHLREVVTAYHRRVRSGCAVAEDAVIVSGFRQGLGFVLSTLAQCGIQQIALEDPGPREHDVIARRAGLDAVPGPVDEHGLDVDRLRETGARAVLVDTGSPMPHRCSAQPVAATRPGGLGRRGRRGDPRRRLRRRVPIRPSAGRLTTGPQLDPCDRSGIGQQDTRSRDPARLGARARTVRGGNHRGEEAQQSRRARDWTRRRSRCSWRRAVSTATCDACGRSTAPAGTSSRPRSNTPSGRVYCRGWQPGVMPCCVSRTGHPSVPSRRLRRRWAYV